METLVGLAVIALVVGIVRAVRQSGSQRAGGSMPPWPPAAGSHDRQPRGPRTPSPVGRAAEFPPDKTDDAFAVGYIIGRHHGQADVDHPTEIEEPSYDGSSFADDSYSDDSDDSGDWGSDE